MKQIAIVLLVLGLASFDGVKREKHEYQDSKVKCMYETMDDRIDGQYVSYYSNGVKKAAGTFICNTRFGEWSVWDTAGVLKMKRNYINPFDYKVLFPKPTDQKKAKGKSLSTLVYSEDGYIPYFEIQEQDVVWARRIWRYLSQWSNPLLFQEDGLSKVLFDGIRSRAFHPYTNDDFSMRKPVENALGTGNIVIGYRIVEDCFYDNKRWVSESRIVGICPVGVDIKSGDTTDLYWLYFPYVRKALASQKVAGKGIPLHIRTTDDLFFYRCFASQIYKDDNLMDKELRFLKPGADLRKESERIEIELLETEHDLWLSNAP
jgi:hypothetical protein